LIHFYKSISDIFNSHRIEPQESGQKDYDGG